MPAPSTASNTPKNARKPAIAGMKGFSVSNIVSILLDFDVHDPANHQEPAEDHDAAPGLRIACARRGWRAPLLAKGPDRPRVPPDRTPSRPAPAPRARPAPWTAAGYSRTGVRRTSR